MAITKETVVDQITVDVKGNVFYREATTILEDGVQLSHTFRRTGLAPGQDTTGLAANVVAICNAAWTPEILAAQAAETAALIAQAEGAQSQQG